MGEGLLSKGHNKSKVVEKKNTRNLGFLGADEKVSLEEMEGEVEEQIT